MPGNNLAAAISCSARVTVPQFITLNDPYAGNTSFVLNTQGGIPGATSGNDDTGKFWFCNGDAVYDYTRSAWASPGVGSFKLNGGGSGFEADIVIGESADFVFDTGDFIIEVVFKRDFVFPSTYRPLVDYFYSGTYGYEPKHGWSLGINSSGQLAFYAGLPGVYDSPFLYTGTSNVNDGNWWYAAATRVSGVFHLYAATLGGTLAEEGAGASLATSLDDVFFSAVGIGWPRTYSYPGNAYGHTGAISQVRITKGTARPGFALPTGPFPSLYGVSGANLACYSRSKASVIAALPTPMLLAATARAVASPLALTVGITPAANLVGKASFAQQNVLLCNTAAQASAQGALLNGPQVAATVAATARMAGAFTMPRPLSAAIRSTSTASPALTTAFKPAAAARGAARGQGTITTGSPILAACTGRCGATPALNTAFLLGASMQQQRAKVAGSIVTGIRTESRLYGRVRCAAALGSANQLAATPRARARLWGRCTTDRDSTVHDLVFVYKSTPQVTIQERYP